MSTQAVRVFPGAYRDSLLLLSATRAMEQGAGVSWASAAMATPATIEDLAGRGFPPGDLAGADANALVLAVCAADGQAADDALGRARAALFAGPARRPRNMAAPSRAPSAKQRRGCHRRTWLSSPCPAPTPRWPPIRRSPLASMSCSSATTCHWQRRWS